MRPRTVVVFAVITLVTTISATPATAHVPPPVWVSTEVSLDLPAIPNAIPAVGIATAGDSAVWTVDGEGAVTVHGDAEWFGDLEGNDLSTPVVGIAVTIVGDGYWLAGADGSVWPFGAAADHGSVAHIALNDPVVGITGTSTAGGYWLVAADGGVFAFGDADYLGSAAPYHPVAPIVGIASVPDDSGYWLAGRDGGVFSFGSAPFHGSMGGIDLDGDVVGMAAVPDGSGYWLAGADGGIFSFGGAAFDGSGYWLAGADGGIFSFGGAAFDGSGAGQIAGTATAIAAVGVTGYVIAVDGGSSVVLPTPDTAVDAQSYYDSLAESQIAIWDALAACESNERWDVNTGNGYYGGLQFTIGSWQSVGGTGFPHEASRIEQIYRGSLVQVAQGWGAWPGCANRLGLL